jgi:undecaprenyl-diphosphatase
MFMDIVKAILMGVVQAVTEFLPVSSSGHLVIAKTFLGLEEVGITMEVVTHLATALAVIVFLRKRIAAIILAVITRLRPGAQLEEAASMDFRMFLYVILGSVPAALVGFLIRDRVEGMFEDVRTTAVMLIVTGVFVFLTGRFGRSYTSLGTRRALLVGVAQAFAIIPGISRSGTTVGAGLASGLERREAFEFSLLLSLPAILGASVLEVSGGRLGGNPVVILAAAIPAFAGGYFAIKLLFKTVIHHKFHAFAYYLIPLGIALLVASSLL